MERILRFIDFLLLVFRLLKELLINKDLER